MITDLSGLKRCASRSAALTSAVLLSAGAERLIVDAACEIADRGHSVSNYHGAGAHLPLGQDIESTFCSCRLMCILRTMTGTDVFRRPSVVPSPSFRLATGFLEAFTIAYMPFVLISAAHWQLFGLLGVLTGRYPSA